MAALFRADKIAAAYNGNLESIKHTQDLENGMVCALGPLVSGEREVRQVKVPQTAADLQNDVFVLHASPELVYDEINQTIADFKVPAGKVGRAYHLTVGDIFTVSNTLIDGTPEVGKYLVPQVGSLKWYVSADGTTLDGDSNTTVPRLVCQIIETTVLGGSHLNQPATVVQVVKC